MEIFIRIVGLYLGVVPPTCILVLSILWLFIVIDSKIHLLMCIDMYSLSSIHIPLWTLIYSFIWNEIVHGISFGISGWYHQYDAYSTPARWSKVTFCIFPGSLPVLLFYQWPMKGWVVHLSSTYQLLLMRLWVSYVQWQTYTSNFFGECWCMWAIVLIGQCFSRASCRCSSYFVVGFVQHGWLTFMGFSVKMT